METLKIPILLMAIVMGAGSLSQAQAQTLIIDPLTATYTKAATELTWNSGVNSPTGAGTSGSTVSAGALIDGSGLSSATALGTPGTTVLYSGTTFPTQNTGFPNVFRIDYRTTIPGLLTFGLNTTAATGGNAAGYDISGIYLYNENESPSSSSNGLASVDLRYSRDGGVTYTDFGIVSGFTQATGWNGDPGHLLNLGTTLTGITNIQFTGGSDFPGNSNSIGFSEIRFIGTASVLAVPEPGVYLMLLSGVAGLIVFGRIRRAA